MRELVGQLLRRRPAFPERTDALVARFRRELPDVLQEARQLEAELLESVRAR
jgi:hypothetical protein